MRRVLKSICHKVTPPIRVFLHLSALTLLYHWLYHTLWLTGLRKHLGSPWKDFFLHTGLESDFRDSKKVGGWESFLALQ